MSNSTLRCPTCKKSFRESDSRTLPFCSDRCRSIDLGRWLTESYTFPATRDPDDEDDDGAGGRARDTEEDDG
ncbi:MAG: DNA gyrase inhibitor YacG [Planctomycetota bacterium]